MANININKDVDDQFYRYKMPRLIAKVEGKGNGIKTVIVNMPEIAKALHRPPTYPTKYFGCELGAQTQFDIKNDRYIVNGSHDSAKLQELLHGFIKKFVLCEECDNPETNLVVKKSGGGSILSRCIACGHQSNVDMRHKLTTFIVKNPPDMDPTTGTTPSKKEKKAGKKGKAVNGDASPEPGDNANTPTFEVSNRVSEEIDDDDVDWGEDVSDAAVAKRMESLTGAAKSMTVTDDLEKSPQERIDMFYEYLKNKKDNNELSGAEREKDVVGEAERLDIKEKAPLILVELLLNANILAQLKQYRTLFLRFTHENPKAQKYMLGGLEQLIGIVHKDELMPKVPHILKMCYDSDIIEEEVILEWAAKVSKKYVSKEVSKEMHDKAEPFIKWLKEAEEESSEEEDEEEEEEDVEVVYSHTEKVGTQTIPKETKVENGKKEEEDDDDDFNIDDI